MNETQDTRTAATSINEATRAIGSAIRGMREELGMEPEDLTGKLLKLRGGPRMAPKTLELIEKGDTDTPLDVMLTLLMSVGIDMQLPDSVPAPRNKLIKIRHGEIRSALFKARHPAGLRKVSFKALSDVSGIEQGQIGRIESGEKMPKFRTVLILMRALDLDVRFVPLSEPKAEPAPAAARAATLRRGRTQRRRSA